MTPKQLLATILIIPVILLGGLLLGAAVNAIVRYEIRRALRPNI